MAVVFAWASGLLWGDAVKLPFLPDELAHSTNEFAANMQTTGRSAVLFLVALIYAPARGFFVLQATLNDMFGVRAVRGPGPVAMVRRKGMAFASAALTFVALFVILYLDTWLRGAAAAAMGLDGPSWFDAVNEMLVLTVLLALVYRLLPDVHIGWRELWVGAAATALLLLLGKVGIAQYLAATSRTVLYGAASSVIAILLFVYYAANALLFGAAFTSVFAEERGAPITPAAGAVRIVKQRVEGE